MNKGERARENESARDRRICLNQVSNDECGNLTEERGSERKVRNKKNEERE